MTVNNFQRGSEWRKWDLHAHTPLDANWLDSETLNDEQSRKSFAKRYISFAKSQNLSAIAITDHNFCDDIENCLIPYLTEEAQKNGIVIFPGFEITAKDGSGIHILVIFPEDTDIKIILEIVKKCFKAGTNLQAKETPVSDKSISEIKNIIKETNIDSIFIYAHADRENGVLHNGTIKGIRRIEEWHNNDVEIVQMSKDKSELDGFYKSVFIEKDPKYYRKIAYILASDCRSINLDSNEDNGRCYLGEKYTWIKADLTFKGLRQAIVECEDRIYVGKTPEKLSQIESNKTKYIDTIEICSKEPTEYWFKQSISLNPELVSIIGNKGSGKSALADIMGLLGNSKNTEYFSFLSKEKFYKDNSADKHYAKLKWLSDTDFTKETNLIESYDKSEIEKVKYIPQSYFEKVCNFIDNQKDFKKEIEKVIFKHLKDDEKLGVNDFDSLVKLKKDTAYKDIENHKNELEDIVYNYVIVSNKLLEENKKLNKSNLDELTKQKQSLEANILALEKNKVEKPTNNTNSDKIKDITEKILKKNQVAEELKLQSEKLANQGYELTAVRENIASIQKYYNHVALELSEKLKSLNIKIEDIIVIQNNNQILQNKEQEIQLAKKNNAEQIEIVNKELCGLKTEKENEERLLSGEEKKYQDYINTKTKYEQELKQILGNETEPLSMNDTYYYYKYLCSDENINHLNKQKKVLFEKMQQTAISIFEEYLEVRKIYENLKVNVDNFIKEFEFNPDSNVKIEFRPKIKIMKTSFIDNIMVYLDKVGTFRGEERDSFFAKLCNLEIETKEDFTHILNVLVSAIKKNLDNNEDTINKSLKKEAKAEDLYTYIFSGEYLDVDYDLEFNNKPISMLSPGERGLLLLTFFLLADTSNAPLILDQPEENLDNQTIYNVLVQLIRNAKKKRQVIIVTHNPNLAVVCDSEQIICANFDTSTDPKINYISGAIENPKINAKIVDILEGTMPAFKNREDKYIQ